MKILIKVTQEILEKSWTCGANPNQNTHTTCAIAEAVREIFPKAAVGRHLLFPSGTISEYEEGIKLPKEAITFIATFDSLYINRAKRLKLKPISFEIDVPNHFIQQIGISEAYKVLSESKTLELVHI